MSSSAWLVAAVLVGVSGAPACGNTPEEDEVIAVLGEVVGAMQAQDATKLWGLSDEASRRAVLEAIATLERAHASVPMVWGKAADEARLALGAPLVAAAGPDDSGRGPRVLAHLVDLEKLDFHSGVMDGLDARDIVFEPGPPERAIIHTTAGETFGFVREGGAWRSLILRDLVLDHPHLKELLANAAKTGELVGRQQEIWRASLDPKTPQGAYNLARGMQGADPPDWRALYALLDPAAHAALGTALDVARQAQKKLQARLVKAQRAGAYDEAGIALHVGAVSDRDLYLKWSATPDFVRPLLTTDPPDRLDGDPARGDVKIVTTTGKLVRMVRDTEGFWRLGDTAQAIEQALVAPAKKVIESP
ncbi:MAG: hypothetical protein IT385_07085 [Deltaproteobacteria bacterium]|nr:hypothetical protein [Deltaproteobacteria bacterium]